MRITIRAQGALFNAIIIDSSVSRCGDIDAGIGAHLRDPESNPDEAGFVLSWDDFERAYLEVKAARAAYFARTSPLPQTHPTAGFIPDRDAAGGSSPCASQEQEPKP